MTTHPEPGHTLKFSHLNGQRLATCTHPNCSWAIWAPGTGQAQAQVRFNNYHTVTA
jgi:hypothetical protein